MSEREPELRPRRVIGVNADRDVAEELVAREVGDGELEPLAGDAGHRISIAVIVRGPHAAS